MSFVQKIFTVNIKNVRIVPETGGLYMKKLLYLLMIVIAFQTAVYADNETDMHQYYIEQIIKTQNVKYNERSFFNAIYSGNTKLVDMFLKAGMTPDTTYIKVPAIYWAITNNQLGVTKLFLDNGADPNAYYGGYTPLFLAIKSKDAQIVEELINHGADVNKEVNNVKPLQYAVQKQEPKIVELLVDAGAKADHEVLLRALKSNDSHIKNLVLKRYKTQQEL